MRKQERTLQQLDPLAAGTSWDVALFFGIATWAYAAVVSTSNFRHIDHPAFLVVALVLFTLGVLVHLWSAAPRHAPYTRRNYSIVVLLVISAGAFEIVSDGGGTISMLTDWGTIAVALIFASASGYRPLPDQYYAGLAAVLTLGTVLAIDGLQHDLPFGLAYFAIAGITLIAIVVLGQASYTFKASRILMAWQKTVNENAVDPAQVSSDELSAPITHEARQFIVGLLDSGRVTEEDTEYARALAGQIRSQLLEMTEQSWVERAGCTLHDPEHVLADLDLSAQSALSALISGMTDAQVSNIQVSLRVDPSTQRLSCVIQGTENSSGVTGGKLRTHLSSFLRVMYVVFEDVRFMTNDSQVNVMFYYAK